MSVPSFDSFVFSYSLRLDLPEDKKWTALLWQHTVFIQDFMLKIWGLWIQFFLSYTLLPIAVWPLTFLLFCFYFFTTVTVKLEGRNTERVLKQLFLSGTGTSLCQWCGKYCASCLLLNSLGNWFVLTLWPSYCRPWLGLLILMWHLFIIKKTYLYICVFPLFYFSK